MPAGDWDRDGDPDIFAIDSSGVLWLYRNNGSGGFVARVQSGSGWGSFVTVIGVGDWDHDTKPDLIAETTAGILRLYRGNGATGFYENYEVGTGWASYTPTSPR